MIKLASGEQKTNEEFLRVTPQKQVPAIDDDGFHLFESSAIMKYLANKYKLPDHWYPSDAKRRAKVDEYLFWHASNLRAGAAQQFFSKVVLPKLTGKPPDAKRIEELEKILNRSLELLESYFLKETPFISGPDISIADLQAVCEISQFWMGGMDLCAGRPKLTGWMSNCREVLKPHFDDVHKMVYVARDRGLFKGKL
eukprot:Em0019g147a